MDMRWETPVDLTTPPGGGKDQILVKQSGADHDVSWVNQIAPATEFKGAIPSSADLAAVSAPSPGDTYVATDSGHLWVWGGLPAQWNEIGSAVAQLPGPVRLVHDDAERASLTGLDEGTLVVQEDSDAVWQWRQGGWKMLLDFVSVETAAERDALASALLPGSLVNVRQEGSIYLWSGMPNLATTDRGWMEILDTPSQHDHLQAQVFDPEMAPGHQLHWFDMRASMEVVPSISDLSDRSRLPASHMVRGKLVYVHGVGRIYELRTEPTALSNTQADWAELGTAVNPPGLEGIIVSASAPNDPGTVRWSDFTAGLVTQTAPGSYWVITDPTVTVPTGVPDLAGDAVAPGDWVIAIDSNGDGTADHLRLVTLPRPTPTRPTVHYDVVTGHTPASQQTQGNSGDTFVNSADHMLWVHDGVDWRDVAVLPPTASASDGDVLAVKDHTTGEAEWKPLPSGVPVGTILMWPSTSPPSGYLVCDGSPFTQASHPELYQVLGGTHVPDMRDRFVRGYNPTGNKGSILTTHEWLTARPRSTFRSDTEAAHRHTGWYRDPSTSTNDAVFRGTGGGGYFGWETVNTEPAGAHDHYITSGGDAETRPDNIIMLFVIKAR